MKVWKSDNTKKIASAASAFSTKKEKTESEGDYIVNYFKRAADPNAADDLEPMAAINIVMTTAKAKCGISITRLTLKACPCPFTQILSLFYPDFIQILSR